MSRTEQLRTLADAFLAMHDTWMAAGDDRPTPDATYWDHTNALVEGYSAGDIPGDCRKLAAAVGDYMDQVTLFDLRTEVDQHMPPPPFFKAVDRIRAVFDAPSERDNLKSLETVAQLDKEGVFHSQIAEIYGWMDSKGQPIIYKVVEELREPGKHTGPGSGWRDPRLVAIERREAAAEQHVRDVTERRAIHKPKPKPPCPESTLQLIKEQVGDEQIADMRSLPVAVVAAYRARYDANEAGLAKEPTAEFVAEHTPRKPAQPIHQEAKPIEDDDVSDSLGDDATEDDDSDSEPAAGSLESQVAQLHDDGRSNREIADLLETDTRTVSNILKRLKKATT